jgi:hypothetical protein
MPKARKSFATQEHEDIYVYMYMLNNVKTV